MQKQWKHRFFLTVLSENDLPNNGPLLTLQSLTGTRRLTVSSSSSLSSDLCEASDDRTFLEVKFARNRCMLCFYQKIEWDRIPTDPVQEVAIQLLDSQVCLRVRSVGPVGDFLDCYPNMAPYYLHIVFCTICHIIFIRYVLVPIHS